MRRMSSFVAEDTNQFGPGTDLIVSMMAMLLVMLMIISYLYNKEGKEVISLKESYEREKLRADSLSLEKQKNDAREGGNFKIAKYSFTAGDFQAYPVTALSNPAQTRQKVVEIARQVQELWGEYQHIFIIGHSNQLDDPNAHDKSYRARLERNWEYAGRRAALIAGLIQELLSDKQKESIVVVTTGELDLKNPNDPHSQENAWVEVIFGKEWKIPSRSISDRLHNSSDIPK